MYVDVDFQAGMFEALKINVMKCLNEDYGVKLIADPKVEMYGEALERICLDMEMTVAGHKHDVKMEIHNTKYSLDIQGFHETVEQKHVHLNNQTVGEYFAKNFLSPIFTKLERKVDISKLNNYLRNLAKEGKKANKIKGSDKCSKCEKEIRTDKKLRCHNCQEHFYFSCSPKSLTEESTLKSQMEIINVQHV